jgi:hypothetical protein
MFTFPQRICFNFFIFLTWNQIIRVALSSSHRQHKQHHEPQR